MYDYILFNSKFHIVDVHKSDRMIFFCGRSKVKKDGRKLVSYNSLDDPSSIDLCPKCAIAAFKQHAVTGDMLALRMFNFISNIYHVENEDLRNDINQKGAYKYIPNSSSIINDFIKLKEYLRINKLPSRYFLDVGCGMGNVLMLARTTRIVRYAVGLELFDETFEFASNFCKGNPDITIKQQDILLYDKYHEYDIIYYYCPFNDMRLQVRLEEKIEDEMKKGAIVMPFYKQGSSLMGDSRFEKIEGCNAFIKIKKTKRKESRILLIDNSNLPGNGSDNESWTKQYPQYNLKFGKQIGE